MESVIRDQIDWQQPFTTEEYAARRARVKAALEAAGYDGMLVTAPRDYYYLSGHDHIWQFRRAGAGLFFDTASGTFVSYDNAMHRVLVSTTPEINEVFYTPRRVSETELAACVADNLLKRGLAKGRVAIQTSGHGGPLDPVRDIGRRLASAGATVVEDSHIIEDVRLYKTAAEVAVMRQAGAIARDSMAAARDLMKPGVMETEIDGVICFEMMKRGCGHPAIPSMIGSGPRSGEHHGTASHRRLKSGDVVHLDFAASLHRYHVNMCRGFAVGEIDGRWHDLMNRSAGCSAAIVAGVKPGDPFSAVQTAANLYIDASGVDRAAHEWFIGGYVLGIAFPPDWTHRHRPQPFENVPDPQIMPGMVFNFEVQYDVFEGWPGGSGAGWIDTFLMTETGLEVLTDMPRQLVAVGGA